jgi:hypothetical protein
VPSAESTARLPDRPTARLNVEVWGRGESGTGWYTLACFGRVWERVCLKRLGGRRKRDGCGAADCVERTVIVGFDLVSRDWCSVAGGGR